MHFQPCTYLLKKNTRVSGPELFALTSFEGQLHDITSLLLLRCTLNSISRLWRRVLEVVPQGFWEPSLSRFSPRFRVSPLNCRSVEQKILVITENE